MNKLVSKLLAKLYFKQWTIGLFEGDIADLVRKRSFNPDINWLYLDSFSKFIADPFFVRTTGEGYKILLEDLDFRENYGKIYLLTLDRDLKQTGYKLLLDTQSHLSYPFVWYDNDRILIFPEASRSGKLSCYEYDPVTETMRYLQDVIDMPLRDATIIKRDGRYWLFGIIAKADIEYKLHIFYSDNLLGPYSPHDLNPVKNSLDGTRPAGNFIIADGELYRPAQNCHNGYGESMTIYKISVLSDGELKEEPWMDITVNRKNRHNRFIHSMHTINQIGSMVVVDGEQWTFAPLTQLKKFIRDIPLFKK
jgi:hypothetical protein